MAKEKVCEAFNNYGESAPDCEWLFTKTARNEKYCDACKPLIKRIQNRIAKAKSMQYATVKKLDGLNFEWKASHIDKKCSCCGEKGVPYQNRFLCVPCYTSPMADLFSRYEVSAAYMREKPFNWECVDPKIKKPGPITLYTSEKFVESRKGISTVRAGMTQDELLALVPSYQPPFHAVPDPIRPGIRYIYRSKGRGELYAVEVDDGPWVVQLVPAAEWNRQKGRSYAK